MDIQPKAWMVYCKALHTLIVVAAANRGQAHAHCFLNAREVGYPVDWKDFACRRAPQFDTQASEVKRRPKSIGSLSRWYSHPDSTGHLEATGCLEAHKIEPAQFYRCRA